MIIAIRSLLVVIDGLEIKRPIEIYAPERADVDWLCRFQIGWPEGKLERWGTGIDAVQALTIAMQMIGAILYTSHYHESGRLRWHSPRGGYGFPVSSNIRDLLVGDDEKFF